MNYRTTVAILAIVAASCSSATPTTTTTTPTTTSLAATTTTSSAAEPQTCEEVADAFIAINQVFLDELGDMSVEEFEALGAASEQGTPWPALDKLGRDGGTLLTRAADELGCSDQDLQRLALSGSLFDQLTPSGPAGEFWLEILSEGAANGEESSSEDQEQDVQLVVDASGAAATGGTPLPDVEGAVLGDDGEGPLPLGEVNELPASSYLNFLSEVCFADQDICFRDAVFTDPDNPDEASGEWVAGQPFHVRHGFINNGEDPLGDGFDLVVYVFSLDEPGEQGGATAGPTSRYTSDYVFRGTSDQCGPSYRTQTGPETCEWFVHDFPDGLPEGRFALWAMWEAPCATWLELGFTGSCDDPSEVMSLFSSGVDSPFF